MKKSYILIALTMVAALSMVSCKCSSKKSQGPTQEEVQEMKQALADSVLSEIDAIADEYILISEDGFRFKNLELTDAEKMVKPDYLLDLALANTFVTKSQKINALAIYMVDYAIRQIYDMPLDETKEVFAKLAVELNHPISFENHTSLPRAERIKMEYEQFKERGDLAYFWQFQNAIAAESSYILAQSPDLFFSKITDEQWQAYLNRIRSKSVAVKKLAKLDPEMAVLYDFIQQFGVRPSDDEKEAVISSCEAANKFFIANKDKYIARRNALLQ